MTIEIGTALNIAAKIAANNDLSWQMSTFMGEHVP